MKTLTSIQHNSEQSLSDSLQYLTKIISVMKAMEKTQTGALRLKNLKTLSDLLVNQALEVQDTLKGKGE